MSGAIGGATNPSYKYDANGNLTSGAGRSIGWTSYDMVSSVTRGGKVVSYLYDSDHRRARETYTYNGALQRTTVYIAGPLGDGPFFERDVGVAGTKLRAFVTTPSGIAATVTTDGGSNWTTQYWIKDHLGSVSAVADSGGNLVERMAFEPFGARRYATGQTDANGSILPASTNRGFTAQEEVDEVGLVNMNGRMYDAALGRFVSADPTVPHPESMQSYNRFSYARNSPVDFVDPSGFADEPVASPPIVYIPPISFSNPQAPGYAFSSPDSFSNTMLNVVLGQQTGYHFDLDQTFGWNAPRDPTSWFSAGRDTLAAGLNLLGGTLDMVTSGVNPLLSNHHFSDLLHQGCDTPAFCTGLEFLLGFATGGTEAKGLQGVEKLVGNLCCFGAGTPVLTEKGPMPIEQVTVGMRLQSRDEKTGETKLEPVLQLIRHDSRPMYSLVLLSQDGRVSRIEVSDNHPFWVLGHGWTDSGKLQRGMQVQGFDRRPVTVVNLQAEGRSAPTYNFTVAEFHTFFAGDVPVLVHNAGPGCEFLANAVAKSFATDAKLFSHFEKHGAEFGAKSASEYLQIGRDIIRSGWKLEYLYKGEIRTGYVQFMGNTSKGNAKFGFVGMNADGALTTIHTESGNSFWKMLNGDSSIRTITPVP